MESALPETEPRVFMMDLLATVPYYTAYLSRALLAEGVALTVGSITYYLDRGCFRTRQIKLDPGLIDIVGKCSLPRVLRRAFKLVEAITNMTALAVRFVVSRPTVVHVQYLPLLHWWLPLDLWFLSYCRSLGSKIVLTVHDLPPHKSTHKYKQAVGGLYSSVDGLICHSDHIKHRLATEFGVPAIKIRTIPHGPFFYDLPDSAPAQARYLMQAALGERIVLWQGILFPYKGLDTLLDAWLAVEAAMPGTRLVVVGTGAPLLLDQIRAQAARLGLKRLTLLFRFASTEELVAIYRAADIVVYPYREITTSGALATGLALGKAIVASNLPVFRELLTSGTDALLVEPNNSVQLSAAIIRLLQDEPLRQCFISAVTAKDFGARSWIDIAAQTIDVYHSVLARQLT